jgi:predicted TIM-barrel fold metal-dependent hydrolase
VKERPSAYIRHHFFHSTYPLEVSSQEELAAVLEMIDGEQTLLFSSNYPNWELGDPFAMIDGLPATLRRRVLVENARALYGERLVR